MRNKLFIIVFLFLALTVKAQYGDCDKALELVEGESRFIRLMGTGDIEEISDTSAINVYWFKKEHATIWLKLPIQEDGELTLDILESEPLALRPDFLLFRFTGETFCSDVKQKKAWPVRTNLAHSGSGKIEATGLSAGAQDEFVSSEGTNPYSKSLNVKKGEVYYLVVDSYSKTGGNVTVGYNINTKGEFGTGKEKFPVNLEKKDFASPSVPLRINVVDDETGQAVTAEIAIDDLVPLETVKEETSEFKAEMFSSQSIRIDANAPGYMFYSQSVMAPALDPNDPSTFQSVNVEIRLKKLKEGDKVALRNIRFQPDKAEFMPGSYPALQSLTNFLQSNPTVHIEIGGHINGPDGSSAAGKAMSKKRAKAVYEYLLKRGIDKKRLKYKGYGNSEMIWPHPQNERQAEENRRVEIKVIKK